jgi:plastocyanin
MEKLLKILIGLVSVAILVVLYYIFVQKTPEKVDISSNSNIPTKTSPSPSPSTNPNLPPQVDITALLAKNPGAGATTEQLKEFSSKVSDLSKDATSIDMTSCNPNPQISRVKIGKPITFKNSDSVSHKVVNGNLVIDIAAKSNKAITPAFPSLGIYGYTCDTKMAGIFLVVP